MTCGPPGAPRPCQRLEGKLYVCDYTERLLAVVTVLGAVPSSAPPRQSHANASLIESQAWETQFRSQWDKRGACGAHPATSGNSRASVMGGFLRQGRF